MFPVESFAAPGASRMFEIDYLALYHSYRTATILDVVQDQDLLSEEEARALLLDPLNPRSRMS
jgi:hypothetical protein